MLRTLLTFLIGTAVAWTLAASAPPPAAAETLPAPRLTQDAPDHAPPRRPALAMIRDRSLSEELARLEDERDQVEVPSEAMHPVSTDAAILDLYPENQALVNPFGRDVSVVSEGLMRWLAPRAGRRWHSGLDLVPEDGPAYGRKIYAPGDGFILRRRDWHPAWGAYLIAVFRTEGRVYLTGFFHLQRGSHKGVQEREAGRGINGFVSRGQLLGRVGRTGAARGAHLHVDVVELTEVMHPDDLPRILWSGRDWSEFVNPADVFQGLPRAVWPGRQRPPSGLIVDAVPRPRTQG